MKILDLGTDERPIEKLLGNGADTLSNVELLAILLRSGTPDLNAIDIGRLIMSNAEGSLTNLSSFSVERLSQVPGIGRKKAATICAAIELGRRFAAEGCLQDRTPLNTPEQVFRIMVPRLKGLLHEECWVLFLNRANILIGKEMLTSGGFSSTTIDTRMLAIRAMEKKAAGVIIVHNHPSGNPHPGEADIRQTALVKDALSPLDISLVDHVVICNDSYFSFAEEKVVIID